jgi:hypothetical protein
VKFANSVEVVVHVVPDAFLVKFDEELFGILLEGAGVKWSGGVSFVAVTEEIQDHHFVDDYLFPFFFLTAPTTNERSCSHTLDDHPIHSYYIDCVYRRLSCAI